MWIVEGAVLEGGELLECQDAGDWARNWGVVLAPELILVAAMAAAGGRAGLGLAASTGAVVPGNPLQGVGVAGGSGGGVLLRHLAGRAQWR